MNSNSIYLKFQILFFFILNLWVTLSVIPAIGAESLNNYHIIYGDSAPIAGMTK